MSGNRRSQLRGARHTWLRRMLGGLTLLVIVALFAVLMVYRPPRQFVDSAAVASSSIGKTVSQTQLDSYCPGGMALADTGSYGDSAFRASAGNIASTARYAAFGSVYSATVANNDANSTGLVQLKDSDPLDSANVKVASEQGKNSERIVSAHLLAAKNGTGIASSVVSWATNGDLKGISASNCAPLQLSQSLLLSDTNTGTTQQLLIANPSSKATSLDVEIHGSSQSSSLVSSTGSTFTVAPNGRATIDLAAAAPKQRGLFVTVSSKQTPVAAVVRTVSMNGLQTLGSDFAMPVSGATSSAVMPSIVEGDKITLIAYGTNDTDASFSWLHADGTSTKATSARISGGKVASIDLGSAPKGTYAVIAKSKAPIRVEAKVTRSGAANSEDFAFIAAASSAKSSAIVLPEKINGDLTIVNTTSAPGSATLQAYDANGKSVGSKNISLGSNAAASFAASDFGGGAAMFTLDTGATFVWGARLSQSDVTAAKLAGVSYLNASALDVRSERIWARYDQSVMH